jgi:hypothetical protein
LQEQPLLLLLLHCQLKAHPLMPAARLLLLHSGRQMILVMQEETRVAVKAVLLPGGMAYGAAAAVAAAYCH